MENEPFQWLPSMSTPSLVLEVIEPLVRVQAIQKEVFSLPPSNIHTAYVLFKHLKKFAISCRWKGLSILRGLKLWAYLFWAYICNDVKHVWWSNVLPFRLSHHSSCNKMTPANIAVVFAPNVLRVETLSSDQLQQSKSTCTIGTAPQNLLRIEFTSCCTIKPLEMWYYFRLDMKCFSNCVIEV